MFQDRWPGRKSLVSIGPFVQQLVHIDNKETSRFALLAACNGNPLVAGGFTWKRSSNTHSVSMSWHQHDWRFLITVTSQWARWRLKSPDSRLFTEPFIQTQIKENIKAVRHWPLRGEFTVTGEFPAQKVSNADNVCIWWRHHVTVITLF